ncbi:MAG: hypothetical protein IID37_03740 [Planctomycetes bacterium]|nr:hypothetical protein [Planctomycetota bacterium]
MEEAAWQRVKEVFHEAVEYAGTERDAVVQTACGDNQAVFNEVSELLASHDENERIRRLAADRPGSASASGPYALP